ESPRASNVRRRDPYAPKPRDSRGDAEDRLESEPDDQIDEEEEQRENRSHDHDHDGRDPGLPPGRPGHLGDLGAYLLGKLEGIGPCHPQLLVLLHTGRGDRTRTYDPRFWRPMLYQLSYAPVGQRARGRYLLNFHDARAEPTLQLPFNDARLPDAGNA